MTSPLMPKATAVWLVDNTSLTFEQIAEFCGLHVLEVKGIADGDVAHGIKGLDPISSGQLTRDEIKRGQENTAHKLKLSRSKVEIPVVKSKKKPKYTPVSRRQDRPNAILWLLKHHPELRDAQIIRLVGTTKPTIQSIKERTHWNSPNLQPADPVTLGLCSQIDLDKEVQKAAKRLENEQQAASEHTETLLPVEETVQYQRAVEQQNLDNLHNEAASVDIDIVNVFGSDTVKETKEEEIPDADAIFAAPKTETTEDEDESSIDK